jgi:glycyl-tRNA synthetase beta chain
MNTQADLLIELLTEELPPKALKKLITAFGLAVTQSLEKLNLVASADHQALGTPRRLAVIVPNVLAQANNSEIEVKGPSIKVALDDTGKPTQALIKWAEKQGVEVAALTQRSDGKQDCFYAKTLQLGARLSSHIESIIQDALAKLPIPKVMQYQLADGKTDVSFIRPAKGLIVLHGSAVLPCMVLGMSSTATTLGHRFLSDKPVIVKDSAHYIDSLKQAKVIASFATRSQLIEAQLCAAASAIGGRLSDNPKVSDVQALNEPLSAYLEEVTALVEWPKIYTGQFEAEFLSVPQECLILTMRTNQKYFPLFDVSGKLMNRYLIVSNMDIPDPRHIIDGNERVIRPRLSDAQFFFEQDKKQTLDSRVTKLDSVVYHAKLGSQAARMGRVKNIAVALASALGSSNPFALRAAQLAKCDLLTDMVGEFPELQGIMGRYYAIADNENPEVAQAIAEQYLPKFSGDALPQTKTGTALALADKLETLCGIWGVGQQPTGDKDPFALRRHALGIVRMLLENALPLKLSELIQLALSQFSSIAGFNAQADAIASFVLDRMRHLLRERGYSAAAIEAVLAVEANNFLTIVQRLEAVKSFSDLPEAQNLAAANKRIGNILRKAQEANQIIPSEVSETSLVEPAEIQLHQMLKQLKPKVEQQYAAGQFAQGLTALAQMRAPVDQFFADVMVNAEDPQVRKNRYALLQVAHSLMNQVADLGRLAA